ncbi:MAG: hypothetical protein J6C46_09710 [Clostridia bacterium]|nr:hypothetical protein [Clostridia bacterium]
MKKTPEEIQKSLRERFGIEVDIEKCKSFQMVYGFLMSTATLETVRISNMDTLKEVAGDKEEFEKAEHDKTKIKNKIVKKFYFNKVLGNEFARAVDTSIFDDDNKKAFEEKNDEEVKMREEGRESDIQESSSEKNILERKTFLLNEIAAQLGLIFKEDSIEEFSDLEVTKLEEMLNSSAENKDFDAFIKYIFDNNKSSCFYAKESIDSRKKLVNIKLDYRDLFAKEYLHALNGKDVSLRNDVEEDQFVNELAGAGVYISDIGGKYTYPIINMAAFEKAVLEKFSDELLVCFGKEIGFKGQLKTLEKKREFLKKVKEKFKSKINEQVIIKNGESVIVSEDIAGDFAFNATKINYAKTIDSILELEDVENLMNVQDVENSDDEVKTPEFNEHEFSDDEFDIDDLEIFQLDDDDLEIFQLDDDDLEGHVEETVEEAVEEIADEPEEQLEEDSLTEEQVVDDTTKDVKKEEGESKEEKQKNDKKIRNDKHLEFDYYTAAETEYRKNLIVMHNAYDSEYAINNLQALANNGANVMRDAMALSFTKRVLRRMRDKKLANCDNPKESIIENLIVELYLNGSEKYNDKELIEKISKGVSEFLKAGKTEEFPETSENAKQVKQFITKQDMYYAIMNAEIEGMTEEVGEDGKPLIIEKEIDIANRKFRNFTTNIDLKENKFINSVSDRYLSAKKPERSSIGANLYASLNQNGLEENKKIAELVIKHREMLNKIQELKMEKTKIRAELLESMETGSVAESERITQLENDLMEKMKAYEDYMNDEYKEGSGISNKRIIAEYESTVISLKKIDEINQNVSPKNVRYMQSKNKQDVVDIE